MGGGGGSQSSTQTVVNYSPEEARRRAMVMDAATRLFNASPEGVPPYPGAQPVSPSQETLQSRQLAMNAVPGLQQASNNLNQGLQFGLHDIIYGEDPTLQNAIKAATRPIDVAFTGPGGYFAQHRADMIGSGMLGSSRDALTNAVMGENYLRAIGDTSAKLAAASRESTLNSFNKTLASAPFAAESAATMPAAQVGAVGASNEAERAAQEEYAAASRGWEMNYPWMNLQNYANIVFGGSAPGTTSTSTADPAKMNPLLATAGGAAAGYALGGMFSGGAAGGAQAGASYGPYGAAVGALLGFLASR